MADKRIETMDSGELMILKKQGLVTERSPSCVNTASYGNGYILILRIWDNYDQLLAFEDHSLKELCSSESEVSTD